MTPLFYLYLLWILTNNLLIVLCYHNSNYNTEQISNECPDYRQLYHISLQYH